jgi:hypothetical protein
MRTHSFQESVSASAEGTQIVIDWLNQLPNLISVWDVQENPFFQERDIDFIVTRKPGITQAIEIKVDSYYHRSPNIFWEEMSNVELDNPGCLMHSQATHIYYYFHPGDMLYIFNLPETRQWYSDNKHRFQEKQLKNKCGRNKESTFTTLGRIIPRDVFIKENEVTVVANISDKKNPA